jgi:SAM-dependent methyltransferase
VNHHVICRSCGSDNIWLVGRGARARRFAGLPLNPELDGGWLYRCGKCDLLLRHPILTAQQYVSLYAPTASDHWTKTELRPEQKRIRDLIVARLPDGGRVLDIGCSSGDLLCALPSVIEKFGIEPSAGASARAKALGIRVLCATVNELPGHFELFDVITAVDVIEHVEDPLSFLQGLTRNLAPGGQIIVSTGNSRASMWMFVGPGYYYSHVFEHLSFISARWCEFASAHGFEVEIIDPLFAHHDSSVQGSLRRLRKYLMFSIKVVLSGLERGILLKLPTTAKRLGPRLMLGEPGLFGDHLLVSFRLSTIITTLPRLDQTSGHS